MPHRIWEPACGTGAVVKVLRAAGHNVVATDLNAYDCPDSTAAVDFLLERAALADCIVTNPPFKLAHQFVAHALSPRPRVLMLLRLAFLETERRAAILEGCGLVRVHVFRARLPMMHRQNWTGRKATSGIAFAWFAWDRAWKGPTELRRISWEREG
ncbi:MAG TPA: class I SAM-dependent methyltransferase [Xanthobacteraceae bacterium]|nr:class I SAM-dependent methyltransferase [Xanthobacteraceae bacterium]